MRKGALAYPIVFAALAFGACAGGAFGSEPITYRMDVNTSKVDFYDGSPGVSHTSENANFNAAQGFTIPIGGVPSMLSVRAGESETLAESSVTRNTHSAITFLSALRDTTLTSSYNEVETENLTSGKGAKSSTKNSSMVVTMNEPRLPPLEIGLSEAESPGTHTSSFRFNTSYSFDSTSVGFSQFENVSDATGRPKSESAISSFSLTNNINPGSGLSLTSVVGLDGRELDSGAGQKSKGRTKRLTTSFSYAGIERAPIRGSYSVYDDSNTAGSVTTKEKYDTLSLFSTVRIANEIYLNLSRTKTNRKAPNSSSSVSDTSSFSLTQNFGSRLSVSFSHSESGSGGGKASPKSDSVSVTALLGSSMNALFNVSEAANQVNFDMRLSFELAPGIPVNYFFSDAAGAETHNVSANLPLSGGDNISIFLSTRKSATEESKSLAYSYGGRLRNMVNYSFSFNDTRAGGQTAKSMGVNLNMPVGGENTVDFSLNNSRNNMSKNTTMSVGVTGRL